MSKDMVVKFLSAVDADSDLRGELVAAIEGTTEQASSIVEIADRHGFEFTLDDYTEVIREIGRQQEGEVSQDELDAVAGGLGGGFGRRPVPISDRLKQLGNLKVEKGIVTVNG